MTHARKKVIKNKNTTTLKSFVEYCEAHPDERFWQALRNWAEVDSILFNKSDKFEIEDTFYREGK